MKALLKANRLHNKALETGPAQSYSLSRPARGPASVAHRALGWCGPLSLLVRWLSRMHLHMKSIQHNRR